MKSKISRIFGSGILSILSIFWIAPIAIVLFNSFKSKVWINSDPFSLPNGETFAGLENYKEAINGYDLLQAVFITVFITVVSVAVILICTSMCAWFITRIKNKVTKAIYILCIFSMVVPFKW